MKEKEMKEEVSRQVRKKRAANGQRDSRMMSFRADGIVVDILSRVANKGRLLNDLVRQWYRQQSSVMLDDDDEHPDVHGLEEYMT